MATPLILSNGTSNNNNRPSVASVASTEFDEDHHDYPPWFECVIKTILRGKWLVIGFCCIGIIWGAFTGKHYVTSAEDTTSAPLGSRAEKDYKILTQWFPHVAEKSMIAMVACKDPNEKGCRVVCPATECSRRCSGESLEMKRAFEKIAEETLGFVERGCKNKKTQEIGPCVTSYVSYYNVSGTDKDAMKCSFASKDGRLTFGVFTFSEDMSTTERHNLIDHLREKTFKEVNPNSDEFVMELTGFDPLAYDGSKSAIDQILHVDMVAMPLAFALIGYMLKSWRLLLLSAFNTLSSVAISFATLNVMSQLSSTKPLTSTSSLVEVLGLAMSIDYSLFYLRRYRDEMKNGESHSHALKFAMLHAGHVVFLSSLTFCMVFLGFLVLPSEDLRHLAQACVVTILIALAICSTNTPAMLGAFPDFFSRGLKGAPKIVDDRRVLGRTVTGKIRHVRGAPYKGWYFALLKRTTKFPLNILLVVAVYALAIPVAMQVGNLEHNQDVMNAIPRGADSAKSFRRLANAFPGGTLSPFYFVVQSDDPQITIDNHGDEFFSITSRTVARLIKATGVDPHNVQAVSSLQGQAISYDRAKSLLRDSSLLCKVDMPACKMYRYFYDSAVSPDKSATLITVLISDNPYGPKGKEFISASWDLIDEFGEPGFHLHLSGDEVLMYADMKVAFDSFPMLIGITCLIISVFLTIGFRSVFVPVRLALSVIIPLAAVFGFGVLIYQRGALDWVGWSALQKTEGGFYWFVPVVSLLQSLGLLIDYDVFIFSRIQEHRVNGYSTQTAIIKGVWETQSTVIAAGLVMTIVFAGLLLGESATVNQFGFLLCASCAVGTFVVQTLITPSIVSISDTLSWAPRARPHEDLISLEDPEFSRDDDEQVDSSSYQEL